VPPIGGTLVVLTRNFRSLAQAAALDHGRAVSVQLSGAASGSKVLLLPVASTSPGARTSP
jgi:hypothetical protein